MPRLVPAVLARMLDLLDQNDALEAVVLARPAGQPSRQPSRRQVLPLAIRIDPAARAARAAVETGQRSLQALVDRLVVFELPAGRWQALDPEGLTLTDVDTREDLDRLART
jgi:hypothetical protein